MQKLRGVHSHMIELAHEALSLSDIDFGISEGLRTLERQKLLVDVGASNTMNSRHLTGHAIDVFAYIGREARWEFELYRRISEAFAAASLHLNVPFTWGGTWKSLDGPHFQLTWSEYNV